MAHSHTARRKVRQAWAKQNVQVGLQRKEGRCNNQIGINQHTADAIETLEGIMQQLAAEESVTVFDVTLVQRVADDTARRLLRSLEMAGIIEGVWAKATRISDGQPKDHAKKHYRLTAAYHKGLAVFEPRRLVGIQKASA